jgi:hypothetical protein
MFEQQSSPSRVTTDQRVMHLCKSFRSLLAHAACINIVATTGVLPIGSSHRPRT